jgi:DNA-binding NtrC family response regulator
MASILMLGLENDLANEMSQVLRQDGHLTQVVNTVGDAVRANGVDIVFAGGDGDDYRDTVQRLVASRPDLPVVLVNRLPETSRWLDALELGAADYCGAPFETVQMRWLVGSVLREPAAA